MAPKSKQISQINKWFLLVPLFVERIINPILALSSVELLYRIIILAMQDSYNLSRYILHKETESDFVKTNIYVECSFPQLSLPPMFLTSEL